MCYNRVMSTPLLTERCRPSEFAALVGVSVRTLRRWDASGFLVASRTVGGRRFYTALHLQVVRSRQNLHSQSRHNQEPQSP